MIYHANNPGRGAKAADVLVEQPTTFDLVTHLTIAKALGITIPEPFLLRADAVIERNWLMSAYGTSRAGRWRLALSAFGG
jgi:hypothetical protein